MKFKKIFHAFVAVATILWSVGIGGFAVPIAFAAATVAVVNGPANAFPGAPISASSGLMYVAKISVTASTAGQTLTSIQTNFSGTGFATSDLLSLAAGATSGVSLWQMTNASGSVTSDNLTNITLSSPTWSGSNVVLTPATPVSLDTGGAPVLKGFVVAVKSSATLEDENRVGVTIPANGVITTGGNGPSSAYALPELEADIATPAISSAWAFTTDYAGTTTDERLLITVNFSRPLQTTSGTALGTSNFTYVDGGGTTQTISSVAHTAGQSMATLTMSAVMDAEDIDGTPATLALVNAKDMGGNAASTSTVNVSSPIGITTTNIPTASVGTEYTSGSPLVTFAAQGGTGSFSFTPDAAGDSSILTTVGLTLATNGKLTGTVLNVPGSYSLRVKVTSGVETSTRQFTLNVATSGGSVPGITSVSPGGGAVSSTFSMTVTGANTSFTTGSTVQFLNNGSNDTNITATVSAATTTSLTLSVTVGSGATAGMRDVKVTTGPQVVTMPSSFTVFASSGSGLGLLVPTDGATGVTLPPAFTFNPSATIAVASYRITVKSTADFTGAAVWDYAFPEPADAENSNGSHCNASSCNITYGNGTFNVVTKPTSLVSNTTYYWQVKTYAEAMGSVSDSATPLESTAVRSFTTTASVSDVVAPTITHRPIAQLKTGGDRIVFARVTDNIATSTSSPALSTSLKYCNSSASCDPASGSTAAGTLVGSGYWKYTLPQATVGHANSATYGIRYYLTASDGTNTTNFKQSDGTTPFTISIASLAVTHKLTGAVTDGASACLAGVTVFAEGTAFNNVGSTTTCAGGTYTLGSIPSGTYDLVALKEGYGERVSRGVFAIPSADSSPAYAFQLTSGSGGGVGGDTVSPTVRTNGPVDGMTNLPGMDANFRVFVVFSEAMSQSTITATNLKVNEVNISTGALTDVTTTKGAWTYYPTAPSGIAYVPSQANMAVWALSGTNTLGDGKTFAVTVSPSVTDTAGNPIQGSQSDGSFAFSFSTGSTANFTDFNDGAGTFADGSEFGAGDNRAPRVEGTSPTPGAIDVVRNAGMVIQFSEPMADDAGSYILKNFVKLYTMSSSTETDVSTAAINTVTLDPSKRNATVALKGTYNSGTLAASTSYRLKVLGGAKAATSMTILAPTMASSEAFRADFKTSASTDSAAPSITGSFPENNAAGIQVGVGAVGVSFNKDMNSSTFTTSTFYLSVTGSSTTVNGTVEYRPNEDQAVFMPSSALSPNTSYTLTMTTGILALNGQALAAATRVFTTGSADTSSPSVLYINADDYNLAVTFSEPMISAKATDTVNYAYSVLKPGNIALSYGVSGFETGTSITIPTSAGFTYDSDTNTLTITGYTSLSVATLQGKELLATVSGVKDLSGNAIGATNAGRAPIASSATTNGALGPGAYSSSAFETGGAFVPTNFSSTTFGFAPPVEAKPFNAMAGKTSIYGLRLSISRQIPANGTVVLTFPVGFNVSGAKQDVNSPMRTDLNGSGTGTPTFKCTTNVPSVATPKSCSGTTVTGDTSADGDAATRGGLADDGVTVDSAARTVTITLSSATASGGSDFLMMDVAGIVNSTVPKDFNTAGYTIDIKTKNGTTLLESLMSQPFFIQGTTGTTYTLSGTITASGAATGTMTVYLMSPMSGSQEATSSAFSSGSATYSFTGLPAGDYWLSTDPSITIGATDYAGKTMPERVVISETADTANAGANDDTIPYNFTIANTATGGTDVTVSIDGPSNTPLDIFAGSMTGSKIKQVTLDATAGAQSFTINLADGSWFVGVGPQMPKGYSSGPPPAPSYLPPKPLEVRVANPSVYETSGTANDGTIVFTLTATTKTIRGTVRDGSDKIIANAEVYAYSPLGGFGTHTQSDAAGQFSMGVTDGSYIVGAFVPGMPPSKEVPVTVTSNATTYLLISGSTTAITPASALTSFILKVAKPDYTISGKVTDGTNVVQGASVYAYRSDGPGHADAMTDSSGNYTVYVSNGTWNIGVFLPQYGNLTETAVTVNGASVSNQNFSPSSTGTFYSISGTVTSNGTAVQGAFVKLTGNNSFNEAITGADGTYSFKAAEGNGYVLRAYVPGVGESAPLAAFNVSGADVTGKNISLGTLRTITVTFSSSVSKAFVDLYSSTGAGSRVEIVNATSGTLRLPDGSYNVNMDVPGTALALTDIAATSEATTYSNTAGIITVDSNEGLTVTLPTFKTVEGTVTDGTNPLPDAWVEITNATSGIHIGEMADANGAFSIDVPQSATYTINAMRPGYVRSPTSISVGTINLTGQTIAMTAATTTITGQVLIGSSGVANAFVRAEKQGGGFSGTQADANGNYTLYVTPGIWNVYAVSEGYAETTLSSNPVDVTSASATLKNITLTSTISFLAGSKSKGFAVATGGTLEDAVAGIKITIPPNAAGSSSSSANLKTKETNKVRKTASAKPIKACSGSSCVPVAKEISAEDSDGTPITTLDDSVTIEMTYTLAELAASESSSDSSIDTKAEADKVELSYWDETTENWIGLQTTVTYKNAAGDIITDATTIDTAAEFAANVSTITFSALTDHFSEYAPVSKTNPTAPDSAPSGLALVAAGRMQMNVSWTQLSGATGYGIYRSTTEGGTYARVGSDPTVSSGSTTSYQDTTVVGGTTYYYKISAWNAGGESAASSAVYATTPSSSGGGGGGGYTAPSVSVSAPNGGETWAKGSSQKITWGSSGVVSFVNLAYSADNGTTWVSVADKILNTGTYTWTVPSVDTSKALVRVQGTDLAVVTASDQSNAVFTIGSGTPAATVPTTPTTPSDTPAPAASPVATTPTVKTIPTTAAPAPAASPVAKVAVTYAKELKVGSKGEDVTNLQKFLVEKGLLKMPKGVAYGTFGAMTRDALKGLQAGWKLPVTGVLDEATRKAMNPKSMATPTVSPAPAASPVAKVAVTYAKELKVGSKGEDVTNLQKFLVEKGLLKMPKGVAYGTFGAMTRDALKGLQAGWKLPVTGVLDEATRKALNPKK